MKLLIHYQKQFPCQAGLFNDQQSACAPYLFDTAPRHFSFLVFSPLRNTVKPYPEHYTYGRMTIPVSFRILVMTGETLITFRNL